MTDANEYAKLLEPLGNVEMRHDGIKWRAVIPGVYVHQPHKHPLQQMPEESSGGTVEEALRSLVARLTGVTLILGGPDNSKRFFVHREDNNWVLGPMLKEVRLP